MIRSACPLAFVCLLAAAPVAAQEPVLPPEGGSYGIQLIPARAGSYEIPDTLAASAQPAPVASVQPVPVASVQPVPIASDFSRKTTRPAALVPMYASFAALQALDYASTTSALASGKGREANPMMSGIVGNRAAFVAVKAAATAGVIYAGEKLWKKNRVGAVLFVAALNGAVAAVVVKNYSVR